MRSLIAGNSAVPGVIEPLVEGFGAASISKTTNRHVASNTYVMSLVDEKCRYIVVVDRDVASC